MANIMVEVPQIARSHWASEGDIFEQHVARTKLKSRIRPGA